jgi:membrane-bound inhibitor of C-type lysozyme
MSRCPPGLATACLAAAVVATAPLAAGAQRPPALPPAGGEQIAAASLTHFGDYRCERGERLSVTLNRAHDGFVDVAFQGRVHTMRPVLSHTGAVRLEDVRGQMLVVQIPTKSMLFDTRLGRRLADDCTHEAQRQAAAAPPAAEAGIGIARPLPAAATLAAAAAATVAPAAAIPATPVITGPTGTPDDTATTTAAAAH